MKFAVCIVTYNRVNSLERCINSVLMQNYSAHEIVVIDNGGSEFVRKRCAGYGFERLRYVDNSMHNNLGAARNLGVELSLADYICFLDDDDYWGDQYLQNLREMLSDNVDAVFSYSNNKGDQGYRRATLKELILQGYTPPVSGQCYRRGIFRRPAFDIEVEQGVDHGLWVRLLSTNPQCKVIKSDQLFVSAATEGRMTTNYDVREEKLKHAMTRWRSEFIEAFDADVWVYFCREYSRYQFCRRVVGSIKGKGLNFTRGHLTLQNLTGLVCFAIRQWKNDIRAFGAFK